MRLAIFDPVSGLIHSVAEFGPNTILDAPLNIPANLLATEVGPDVQPWTHCIDIKNDDTPILRAPDPAPDVGDDLRSRRDRLLFACDWTQLPDAPLSAAQKAAWRSYRQALRDLPETGDWPDPPDLTE